MHPGQSAQTLRHREHKSRSETSQDLMRRWRGHPSRDVGLHTHGWSCRCCGTGCDRQPGPTGSRRRSRRDDTIGETPAQECPRQQDRERCAGQQDRGEEIATRAIHTQRQVLIEYPAQRGVHRMRGCEVAAEPAVHDDYRALTQFGGVDLIDERIEQCGRSSLANSDGVTMPSVRASPALSGVASCG